MLERCIALEPRFVQAYLELLLLKPNDRRRILDKLLELDPGNWEHYVLYGDWMKERGLQPLSMQYYMRGMRLAFARGSARGEVVLLRAASLILRSAGQRARILQLLTRWHVVRDGGQSALMREQAARAWRLRSELAERAALYSRPARDPSSTSTCLHHSQLEVPPESYTNKLKENTETTTIVLHNDAKPAIAGKVNKKSCQKSFTKKSVSMSAQYKHTHNKSESGHKQKSCPLHKKKKIKDPEALPPFTDHFIKTY